MKTRLILLFLLSPLFTFAQISGILDIKFLSTVPQVKAAMLKKGAKLDLKTTNSADGVYAYTGLRIGESSSTTTIFHFLGGEFVLASVLFLPKNDPDGVEIYKDLRYGISRQYNAGNDLTKISYPYDGKDTENISAIRSGYVRLKHEWEDGDEFTGRIELSLNENLLPILVYQHRPTMVEAQMAKERVKRF